MSSMSSATVIPLEAAHDRRRRVARAVEASRRLREERRVETRRGGRAWINGSELGGAQEAFAHLAASYD